MMCVIYHDELGSVILDLGDGECGKSIEFDGSFAYCFADGEEIKIPVQNIETILA